mmetsp:Transcript_13183/g.19956  ORF Transcript_13183/g.19956 Transcript_13183/m.19956 type:complete len:210 (+) Transcript_13183:570-1199(+)
MMLVWLDGARDIENIVILVFCRHRHRKRQALLHILAVPYIFEHCDVFLVLHFHANQPVFIHRFCRQWIQDFRFHVLHIGQLAIEKSVLCNFNAFVVRQRQGPYHLMLDNLPRGIQQTIDAITEQRAQCNHRHGRFCLRAVCFRRCLYRLGCFSGNRLCCCCGCCCCGCCWCLLRILGRNRLFFLLFLATFFSQFGRWRRHKRIVLQLSF